MLSENHVRKKIFNQLNGFLQLDENRETGFTFEKQISTAEPKTKKQMTPKNLLKGIRSLHIIIGDSRNIPFRKIPVKCELD